jgi:protein-S-isoprenylcysteine O-methyltransferase Ste14
MAAVRHLRQAPGDPRVIYRTLFPLMWGAWMAYWAVTSGNVKDTERRESTVSRWLHLGPLLVAIWLVLVQRTGLPWLDEPFLPRGPWPYWLGVALTAAGLLFAIWARRHIGRNWSATVTIKKGHELVTTGPYALVRHPIYSGLLLAMAGTALARGEWRGIVAVVIVFLALWRKLRLEERWMRERFGAPYEDYAKRVKALIPFVF